MTVVINTFFIASNYDKIIKLVEDAKRNTQWRKQFMDFKHHLSQSFREGKEAGFKEGLKEGEQNKAVETATTSCSNGTPR